MEHRASDPALWENGNSAAEFMQKLSRIKEEVSKAEDLRHRLEDLELLCDLAEESEGKEAEDFLQEASQKLEDLDKRLQQIELQLMFAGKFDANNALMAIHPGAGGLEAQDWVEMLMRMYARWAENRGMEVEVLDYLPGEEAGVKSVTFLVKGPNAYGWLQSEKGVHRMVRISPFDAGGRRHTSFASVEVIPEVQEEEFYINPEEVKMDTFRAKGAGGQHVNTTDSAVRLTHLPTGIVAQCQNERSQHSNRYHAMKILEARVADYYRKQKEEELESLRGEQKEIAWGSQIRSYTFHPFSLVKDHRTGVEEGNTDAVMDGRIDVFQESYLIWKSKGN